MNHLAARLKEPAWQQTLGYYGLIVCLGLSVGTMGPLLPALAAQTHSQVGQMGQLFLAGALGGVLGTLLGGRLYDRLPGHVVLGTAQVVAAVLLACLPFMPTLSGLLIVAGVKGVTDGVINSGVNTLLVWTHREKVSPFMNALHFCFGLGAFVAPLLVAQVVDIAGAYRWLYVGLAVFSLLAGLRLFALGRGPHADHPAAQAAGAAQPQPLPYRVAVAAALFLFFYVGAEIAFGGWVYTYAVSLNLASAAQAAYLTSGFWLAFTAGRLLSVPVATRFAPRRVIAVALVGCLAFMGLLYLFGHSSAMLWVAAVGVGFCMAPIYPSGFTLAVEGHKLTAAASGTILLGDSFGGMVLPWLVGQVLDHTGPRALVYLVLVSLTCDLVVFILLLRTRANLARAAVPQRLPEVG